MKNNNIFRFLIHTVIYVLIAFFIYFLYNPLNKNSVTRSAISFVYQQF